MTFVKIPETSNHVADVRNFSRIYSVASRIVSNISFRDILAKYVYTLALAFNILPIDSNYQNIRYVVFNSAAMDKLGKSLFNDNQIFQSKEMNILNLILSQED